MYVAGFVIPVPEDKRADYLKWAEMSARIFGEYSCLEMVEAWEEDVPDGKQTDFRRAVAAKPGKRIVFSRQVWPDKATVDQAWARMQTDPRLDPPGEIPFDARRLIYGGFRPVFTMGRR